MAKRHWKSKLKAPKPANILRARQCLYNLIKKYGTKRYRKKRKKTERIVQHALRKYHLKNRLNEQYWYLAFYCILIGK